MDLLMFGFQHTNFKTINMESCEEMANIIKEYIFLSLCDEELCEDAKFILD